MATNIGRVEFIVDLDGDKIPAQARALGNKIAAAGQQAGKQYSQGFDTEFERGLSTLANKQAGVMNRAGRLGAERFATTFERVIRSKADSIQANLASILADKDAFKEAIAGWDDLTEATTHYENELDALNAKWVTVGKGRPLALIQKDTQQYKDTLHELIAEEEQSRIAAEQQAAARRALATETERVEAQVAKLARSLGDTDAIRKAGDASDDYKQRLAAMQAELDGLHDAQAINLLDYERYSDTLDKTSRDIEKQIAAEEKHRNSVGKSTKAFGEHASVLDKVRASWRRVDGTVKLVIISIVTAADEVATLGSALGAGVVALGGALSAVAVGGIGIVSLFAQLNDELEDLPTNLRPAAKEFQALGKTFGEIGEAVAGAAVANMGAGFAQIDENIRALIPNLEKVGAGVGRLVDAFGESTKEGGKAFGVINDAIEIAVPNFESLAGTAGTFGVALIRSFNRAQPLVEDLLGWLDRLADQFDTFSQSTGFEDWITNAQTVFGSFGTLLDTVSRGLNDLVTPQAVARTAEFLDNLTRFTPNLVSFLDIMGDFDMFGLLAQLLADFGEAMEPLAEPTKQLAGALNELVSTNIDVFTAAAGALATAMAPLVEGFANFIDTLPPSSMHAIAVGIIAVASAFGALQAVIGVSALVTGFKTLTAASSKLGPAANIAATGMGKLAKGLGVAGGIAVGVGALANTLTQLAGATAKAAPGVESILLALGDDGEGLGFAFSNASAGADSFAESLELVAGSSFDSGMERFGEALGGVFGVQGVVTEARSGMAGLDAALAQLVSEGKFDEASDGFREIEDAAKAQGIPIDQLVTLFPQYADAVAGSKRASQDAADGITDIGTEAGITVRSIEDLADAINGFGDTQLTANAAARDYAASLDAVVASVAENGTAWGVATAEGRANMEAVDGIAEASLKSAEAIKKNTGSQELSNAAIADGRAKLIEQLAQFGITGEAAEDYADSVGLAADGNGELTEKQRAAHADLVNQLEAFGLTGAEAEEYATKLEAIPGDVESRIALLGAAEAKSGAEGVKTAIDNIKSKTVTLTLNTTRNGDPIYRGPGGGLLFASGAIVDRPTRGVFGEAGPEALVPLKRPLNQVDPAVRAMSAFAQGLPIPGRNPSGDMSSSTSRSLTIAPGAITIQGDRAPETTATNVVNRIAQRLI